MEVFNNRWIRLAGLGLAILLVFVIGVTVGRGTAQREAFAGRGFQERAPRGQQAFTPPGQNRGQEQGQQQEGESGSEVHPGQGRSGQKGEQSGDRSDQRFEARGHGQEMFGHGTRERGIHDFSRRGFGPLLAIPFFFLRCLWNIALIAAVVWVMLNWERVKGMGQGIIAGIRGAQSPPPAAPEEEASE